MSGDEKMSSVSPQGLALGARFREALETIRAYSSQFASMAIISLLALAVTGIIVTILWVGNKSYSPLYGNNQAYEPAEIINVLETAQIPYELHPVSGQVLVPRDQVAAARLKLAANGVTERMPTGIESLDNLSEITTSQFMESNRYTHAVEGELAKTIMTINGVVRARVHLAIPERTLFVGRKEQIPTASVVLDLTREIDAEQVKAIANLVSGSITGMNPESVRIVDQRGTLLSEAYDDDPMVGSGSKQLEYISKIESRISKRASQMLIPVLGQNNFIVEVSANVDFSQIEETSEQLDGTPFLLQESTVSDSSLDAGAMGIPGALANQPPEPPAVDGEEGEAGDVGNAMVTREEANRKFDTSRSIRKVRFGDSRLQSFSLSVLVNQKEGEGNEWTQEQLDSISESVRIATGLEAERGDQFTLQVADFMPPRAEPIAEKTFMELFDEYEPLVKYALATIFAILILWFVVRPLVAKIVGDSRSGSRSSSEDKLIDVQEPAPKPEQKDDDKASDYFDEADAILAEFGGGGIMDDTSDTSIITMSLPEPGSPLEEQLAHLRLLANKETDKVSEIVKTWITQ